MPKWLLKLHLLAGCAFAILPLAVFAEAAPDAKPGDTVYRAPATVDYPQQRIVDGMTLVIHAPQIREWPDFQRFEAVMAVEVSSPDGPATSYGTATLGGATEIDLETRLVRIRAPRVDSVTFTEPVPDSRRDAVMHAATRTELDVPLDLFLAYLADDVLSDPPPPGFNTDPPPIAVRSKPTLLLSVNGEPVMTPVPDTALQRIVNANWPLFRSAGAKQAYYLLEQDRWLMSTQLEKGWKAAKSLPEDFAKLPAEPEYAAAQAALPPVKSSRPLPAVLFATAPTELIVTDGKPELEPIGDADGLEFVSNTQSPLFRLDGTWYYLVAGRWFTTTNLDKGPWTYAQELPAAFSLIPDDHPLAGVRASVPGTVEAKMAALEALLPTRVSASKTDAPSVEVSYAGEPEFEPVAGTSVARAVNTGLDILECDGRYYLLHAGIWYEAPAATGPWTVTASVPAAIYQIPPSSPSYNVTQVKVVESTPTTVVYSYPPSYSSSVYVVYGVPYYGTGWYYPPYIWGRYYYPYPVAYGYGSWYNPATGGYGSRSVWYGPYGGYSYNQGYNPQTGRYGYVETGWDGDEWASYGETYNPRTGVASETSRYYDEDRNRSEMERTTQKGDDWMTTKRNVDYDQGAAEIGRDTSKGGSSVTTRQLSDGTLTSSSTVTTGDGRTFDTSSEATRSGGSSTIIGEQGSVDINTKREDGRSASTIEGSGGGQGVSFSGEGPGRTTLGQSGSGDLYAGHDGNVYKKTEDGWQHYEDGGWQPADTPERAQGSRAETQQTISSAAPISRDRNTATTDYFKSSQNSRAQMGTTDRDHSQLNRDYSARQRGSQQFQQRAGSRSGMAMRSGGTRSGGMRRR